MAKRKSKSDQPEKHTAHKYDVRNAIVTFIALVSFCAACIAWFVNNARVTGSGVQIETSGARFVLATKEQKVGAYDPDFSIDEGTPIIYNGDTYYTTSAGMVSLRVGGSSNMNNLTQDGVLQPGARGQLTFYIIPLVDNLKSVTIHFETKAYRKSGEKMEQITDDTIQNLLQGHILWFKTKNNEVYANLLDGTYIISPTGDATAFTQNQPQEVTVYWVWPERFRNYAYTSQVNQDLFADTKSPDYETLVTEMKTPETQPKYFYNFVGSKSDLTALKDIVVSNQMTDKAYAVCDKYYNQADQKIGENVNYLQIQLEGQETTAEGNEG